MAEAKSKEQRKEGGRRQSLRQQYQVDATDDDVVVKTRKRLGGGGKVTVRGCFGSKRVPTGEEPKRLHLSFYLQLHCLDVSFLFVNYTCYIHVTRNHRILVVGVPCLWGTYANLQTGS